MEEDDQPKRMAIEGTPKEQLLRARLDRIGQLARGLVGDARLTPQKPAFALVRDLIRIVDEAES